MGGIRFVQTPLRPDSTQRKSAALLTAEPDTPK